MVFVPVINNRAHDEIDVCGVFQTNNAAIKGRLLFLIKKYGLFKDSVCDYESTREMEHTDALLKAENNTLTLRNIDTYMDRYLVMCHDELDIYVSETTIEE